MQYRPPQILSEVARSCSFSNTEIAISVLQVLKSRNFDFESIQQSAGKIRSDDDTVSFASMMLTSAKWKERPSAISR